MTKSSYFSGCLKRGAVLLPLAAVVLGPTKAAAQARSLAGGVGTGKVSGSSSSSATSQTATAATAQTAQAAQAAATASQAQTALSHSVAIFQQLEAQQMAAQTAAINNASVNLGSASLASPINGLTAGSGGNGMTGATAASTTSGLVPLGGMPSTTTTAIQVVDLSGSGKNQLNLSNGGQVTLPNGTSGSDQVSITGAGSVTSTSGNVSASAGSLTTTTGGTLDTIATNGATGGSISLTAGNATLSTTTAASITSTVAGSYTAGGTTTNFAAGAAVTVPAGATVSFSGSSAATVTITGAATVKLSGAGTLALSNAAAGAGGTITTNSGTTQFTDAAITSEPAGTTISLNGSGSVDFSGASGDILPVILEPQAQVNPTTNTTVYASPAFTTTGNVLQTTSFVVPSNWSLGTGGQLSESYNSSTGQYVDTITQERQTALLYWQSFNIGKNTTLDFDQSAGGADVGNWVAINRVLDPSLNPAQILGQIEAPGQVYVIDQNGIVFSKSAQVDTHALVASTLPINTNLVTDGFLNNPDGQYLFSSQVIPAGNSTPAYDPNNDFTDYQVGNQTLAQANTLPNTPSGAITVDEGANLFSPGSAEGVGGKIALIAPTIQNHGDIESDDGQVILAAGQQVGFEAHPSSDPSLRGLDVAVGAADTGTPLATGDPSTDTVINEANSDGTAGLIYAPEGDVTIAAPNIEQFGVIESTTSVALNGRIDLLAMSGLTPDPSNNFLLDASASSGATGGSIELGPNSLTEILPDYADPSTEVGSSLALPSQVYVEGESFQMDSGAQLIAPNATTTFSLGILNTTIAAAAGETTTPLPEDTGVESGNTTKVLPGVGIDTLSTAGTVNLESGATIDVSGSSDVQASVAENIVQAQLTDAVLENDALQRDGALHGATVSVDITQTGTNADGSTWVGSPIGDLSGYANVIEHNVGELTINGGSVNIDTNGSVNLSPGSTINVSGGSIDYQGATVATTYLLAADGQIVNIADANPSQLYTGIYDGFTSTSAKWDVTQNFSPNVLSDETYDPGYVEGGNGGSLTVTASSVAFSGSLYGNTTMGVRQQTVLPSPSTFTLGFLPSSPIDVVIQPSSDPTSTEPATIDLSPDLFGVDGFSNASIDTGAGNITMASDAVIATLAGGSLNLTAENVDIYGQIYVPSGAVSITASAETPAEINQGGPSAYTSALGNIEEFSGAVIATTGLTFDELSGTAPGTLPFSVNGGKVTLSGAATTIDAGAFIDASGGIARSSAAKLYEGKGGSISITGLYTNSATNGNVADGAVEIAGSLSAYGIGQGGSLSVTAPAVVVGNNPPPTFPGGATPLTLSSSFFSEGGFSNISLAGSAGVQILDNTMIAPVFTEEIADTTAGQFGVSLVSSSQLPAYPAAPVSLTFSAPGVTDSSLFATLSLGAGSAISVGPTGAVTLSGQLVSILGQVSAPGGAITVKGDSTQQLTGELNSGAPDVSVYLGPQAALSVSGEEITTPTIFGSSVYNAGEVLPGGSITITGNIVTDPNAALYADGAAGVLSVPTENTVGDLQATSLAHAAPYTLEVIGSNGGSIGLNGLDELYYEGSLSASAGNASTIAGSLTVESGIVPTSAQPPDAGFPELFIRESAENGFYPAANVTLGQPLPGGSATGGGFFTVDQFNGGSAANNGNFGSLILKGNVEFENGATEAISITASQQVQIVPDSHNGTVFSDGSAGTISIAAPYIAIGATTLDIDSQTVSSDAPSYVSQTIGGNTTEATPTLGLADPTFGATSLLLQAADLIDVSFLSLQGFGNTTFSVPTGGIRGGGLFYAAGDINLTAGQIYTPTAASFTVAAFGSNNSVTGGVITISNPGDVTLPLPYSAAGMINIFASTIDQNGTLEAPFGVINLGALPDASTGMTPVLAGIQYMYNGTEYVASANTAQNAPTTTSLILGPNSITSVSGVSGSEVLDLPYGTIENGTDWIAPNGQDITAGGLPAKAINLMATNVDDMTGSVINLTGGGDLFAYQFNPGVGGTNDILSEYKYVDGAIEKTSTGASVSSTSFAIVPTYDLNYAPIDFTIDSSGDFPYASPSVTSAVGNEIYLAGGDGLAAGTYAILPARYALVPGAYLVTPTGSTPTQTSSNPDGSLVMAGYYLNTLNSSQQIVPSLTGFQVESIGVIDAQAPYTTSSANSFLSASAVSNGNAVPRLPQDAGQLAFDATQGLEINGSLDGQAGVGGLGSIVDISSSDDIYIVSTSGESPTALAPDQGSSPYLTLSADQLDAFGAGSLLIGGTRSASAAGTVIDPTTDAIYVQNSSSDPLEGSEIILASNGILNLAPGSDIAQSGVVSTGREDLIIGSASTAGSGNGVLLAVSGDPELQVTRLGVNGSDTTSLLTIGNPSAAGADPAASISGVAVVLDSTGNTVLDPNAEIDQSVAGGGTAESLVLSSGAISLQVNPGADVSSAPGLVLTSNFLQSLASVQSLSLSSYSSINLYSQGNGTIGGLDSSGKPVIQSLTLSAAGIFGYASGGGEITINAANVTLGNPGNDSLPGSTPSLTGAGNLTIDANTIDFGGNTLAIDGFTNVTLNANDGTLVSGTGALYAQGALTLAATEITGATGANYTFDSQGGALQVTGPLAPGTTTVTGGLGASITLDGTSVTVGSTVYAASGTITATAGGGAVEVTSTGTLAVTGTVVTFGTAMDYTSGGVVNLTSQSGDVQIDQGALVNVSALSGGANAGTMNITALKGTASVADGALSGTGGAGGSGGVFNATLSQAPTLSGLTTPLTDGGFQTMNFDVLNGSTTVDGAVGATTGNGISFFTLTSENGAITVANTINASGPTGGTINLYANGGVTLTSNAVLDVTGQALNDAGEGGTIDIETEGANGEALDIASGLLELGVGTGSSITAAGTVHLRAPLLTAPGGAILQTENPDAAQVIDQTPGGIAIDSINASNINKAGTVIVEGYRVYQPSNGMLDSTLQNAVQHDVENNFPTATLATQLGVSGNSLFQIQPGIEIINPNGNLQLGSSTTSQNYNWNLASARTAAGLPGILTLRASANLIFYGSLTDGFADNPSDTENNASEPYTWDLLPAGSESWSYRLVSGAAFTSAGTSPANFGEVQSLTALGLDNNSLIDTSTPAGSLLLGVPIPAVISSNGSYGTKTSTTGTLYAQMIRTGTGNITIDAGGSVDLMNQMATIYTAGQQAPSITNFNSPTGQSDSKYETTIYGKSIAPATQYTAQYTENGGNVTVDAQQDIAHLTVDSNGDIVADTTWQFPTNWLYRRGASSSTGVFDTAAFSNSVVASTTWWVDFSNFFEGIGALGGGNVSLNAGGNIVNVDAVVPTNERTTYNANDTANVVKELGGGDLSVIAAGTIEGGTYYVEKGTGLIEANTIETTYADDPARVSAYDVSAGDTTPLPLTLFVGDSSFTVEATNGITIGSTVNPFLLPQGIGNNFNNESIFSTYGADSTVSLSSLLSNITIQGAEFEGNPLAGSLYDAYLSNAPGSASTDKSLTATPWTFTLDPTNVGGFDNVDSYTTLFELSPPVFDATAFSGNIQYASDQVLAPSAAGTLRLLAAGTIDGAFVVPGDGNAVTANITVLNNAPSEIPSLTNPSGLGQSTAISASNPSIGGAISLVSNDLSENASYTNLSFAQLQSLNTPGLLHDNTTTPPVELATINGDIGDLTLISPERTDISSGLNIQDVSFYIQNNNAEDVSVVSANGNITLFDPTSTALEHMDATDSFYEAFGDLQISGPGTLEVLAGGNLDLGEGSSPNGTNYPGTGLGITSIGNARDPYLPFGGANVIAAAGLGTTSGLGSQSSLVDMPDFIVDYLNPNSAPSSVYLPDLGSILGLIGVTDQQIWDIFSNDSTDSQDATLTTSEMDLQSSIAASPDSRGALATSLFYNVLRDAGRNHNNPESASFGTYQPGFTAISTLFPASSSSYSGDISLTSREIKTTNGGDINLLAPGGEVDVGLNNNGAQAIDQGILTVDGGNISIYANDSVNVGTSRIFTLHGGNIIIWSSTGNIDAGAASRTVQSAPPTRVEVDSQSANVETDLAGLATGGGIGVLETVVGAPPGNVDLIAPVGTVNAGDAGIRASGNVNVAAAQVLNAGNIQAGGSKTGVPTTATPNIAAAVAASNTAGSTQNAAASTSAQQQSNSSADQDLPSIISVEVLGYGGDDDSASTEGPSDRKAGTTYLASRPVEASASGN